MSGEMLAGQDTPSQSQVEEAQNLAPQESGNHEPQTDGGEVGQESPAPAKTFTQSELDAIVAREKAKAERKALREVRQQLQSQMQPQQPQHTPSEGNQPNEQAPKQPTKADIEAYLAQERAETAKTTFLERLEDATERFPDIMTVVSDPRLPFTEQVIEFLADSDVGVDMAHWLAKNPGKFGEVVRMSPLKAGRELSRIEADIKARPKAQLSKAPEPIKPVGNRGSSPASALPSDEDDIATWMEKERKRQASR